MFRRDGSDRIFWGDMQIYFGIVVSDWVNIFGAQRVSVFTEMMRGQIDARLQDGMSIECIGVDLLNCAEKSNPHLTSRVLLLSCGNLMGISCDFRQSGFPLRTKRFCSVRMFVPIHGMEFK